mmetsp:Transcript_16535/g.42247  ORF Transcript_16535/g.42247 Transcript_16535/m.42247 type:complete len:224 (-) Transcript_16535:2140-2811(-)
MCLLLLLSCHRSATRGSNGRVPTFSQHLVQGKCLSVACEECAALSHAFAIHGCGNLLEVAPMSAYGLQEAFAFAFTPNIFLRVVTAAGRSGRRRWSWHIARRRLLTLRLSLLLPFLGVRLLFLCFLSHGGGSSRGRYGSGGIRVAAVWCICGVRSTNGCKHPIIVAVARNCARADATASLRRTTSRFAHSALARLLPATNFLKERALLVAVVKFHAVSRRATR